MKKKNILASVAMLMGGMASLQSFAQNNQQQFQGTIGKTLNDSKEWWAPVVKAPAGAPNVVLIVLDDVGFGGSSAFELARAIRGGGCQTVCP